MFNLFMPKPFDEGFLPPEDGHEIHYLQYGNPDGEPVLSFHGGPGGSSRPKYAKLFNRRKYRFIQFDQRGCGLSKFTDLLKNNTTQAALDDASRLLKYLCVKKPVIVHGVSWGSALALLYAEAHPRNVAKIAVSSVFLARGSGADWVKHGSELFYPDLWDEMRKVYGCNDFYDKFCGMLFSDNKENNLNALFFFGSYEHKLGQLNPQLTPASEVDEAFLRETRVYFHFDRNNYFVEQGQILKKAAAIKKIPALILHNRMDFCCPVKQAWDLHKALPASKLTIMPRYGHSTSDLLKEFKKQMKKF